MNKTKIKKFKQLFSHHLDLNTLFLSATRNKAIQVCPIIYSA